MRDRAGLSAIEFQGLYGECWYCGGEPIKYGYCPKLPEIVEYEPRKNASIQSSYYLEVQRKTKDRTLRSRV